MGGGFLLLIDMHHIIADGLSMGIFIREFMALLEGKELPPLKIQYKEYAQWQQRELRGERMAAQEAFWLEQFAEEVPALDWPSDFTRPRERDFKGGSFSFKAEKNAAEAIKTLASGEGATLFTALLALYNILLTKLCNQTHIVVGAPTAGRFHVDLEPVIGMFINTLALKNNPQGHKTVREFLREVKQNSYNAFANQDYQYDELVEKLGVTGNGGRNPLFDTMLMLQNLEMPQFQVEGLTIKPYDFDWESSKFDLTLLAMETPEGLDFTFEYNANLFLPGTIKRFASYFRTLMASAIHSPDQPVKDVDMLPEQEKQRLLEEFNDTAENFPADKTIFQLLEQRAREIPGAPALVFQDRMVTFGEFHSRSNRLAHFLRALGMNTGDRVAVCMERSLELIISLVAIMKAGAAYVPLDPTLPLERLRIISRDACIHIALTQRKFRKRLNELLSLSMEFKNLVMVDDAIHHLDKYPDTCPHATAGVRDPAYVMYTSGSSGTPKGVVVEHRTIVNTLIWRGNYYEYKPGDVSLRNPPYFFDSSVTDIFTPLLGGARLVLTAEAHRIDPGILKDVIRKYCVSHFIVVPAFYNLLLEEIGDYMTGLKKICCAGEHFPDELIKKHFQRLPHVHIVNEYGPTENSVNSTEYLLSPDSPKALIGKPISNVRVYLLDRYLNPVPIGVTGEICLAGSSLARGYLNNPELTDEKFVCGLPVKNRTPIPESRFYLTGDLARWHEDGNLEFMGRLDTQVKIRGIRVETGEIENLLMRHEDIKEAIVLPRNNGGDENYLCAYLVTSTAGQNEADIKQYLSRSLPEYMVPSYIMFIDAIPFTPTGKIHHAALPEPRLEKPGGELVPPRNPVEQTLVELFAAVLEMETEEIGTQHDFFQLGGNSLKAARLVSRIHKALEARVPLADVFKTPTVRDLAEKISRTQSHRFKDIQAAEERQYYPLSFNQRRLWVISQLEPGTSAYHIPGRIDLEGVVKEETIIWAIRGIIQRHQSLRTGFTKAGGAGGETPVQFILPSSRLNPSDLRPETLDLSGLNKEKLEQELKQVLDEHGFRPFDLACPPLVRFLLITMPGQSLCLAFTMHHIVGDGFSLEILKKEFMALLRAAPEKKAAVLPPLELQYKDFANWQNSGFGDTEIKERAHRFWRGVLERELAPVALPGRSSGDEADRSGGSYRFTLDHAAKDRLNALAREHHCSLFTLLLALFNILLSRVSGQRDILVGLPVSGRDHESLQHMVGFFVNTVVLDTHVSEEKRFSDFLENVNSHVLEVLQHQAYPLESVLADLRMPFPNINVFFNMLNIDASLLERNLESFEPRHMEEQVEMKFDLMMYLSEYANGMELFCNYRKAVLDPVTIAALMDRYVRIIGFFAFQPEKRIIDFKKKKRSLKRTK